MYVRIATYSLVSNSYRVTTFRQFLSHLTLLNFVQLETNHIKFMDCMEVACRIRVIAFIKTLSSRDSVVVIETGLRARRSGV
jgi:hypothetical protein